MFHQWFRMTSFICSEPLCWMSYRAKKGAAQALREWIMYNKWSGVNYWRWQFIKQPSVEYVRFTVNYKNNAFIVASQPWLIFSSAIRAFHISNPPPPKPHHQPTLLTKEIRRSNPALPKPLKNSVCRRNLEFSFYFCVTFCSMRFGEGDFYPWGKKRRMWYGKLSQRETGTER